jgi:hypothetical protein
MGLFQTILEKIGLGKEKKSDSAGANVGGTKPASSASKGAAAGSGAPGRSDKDDKFASAGGQKPAAISEVDVVANLEKMAAANPAQLNWKVSIVDLLKLLGMDSSFEARKELATELGCPADLMNDSAKMNVWLHKTVLKKIAENGGNIPRELLD